MVVRLAFELGNLQAKARVGLAHGKRLLVKEQVVAAEVDRFPRWGLHFLKPDKESGKIALQRGQQALNRCAVEDSLQQAQAALHKWVIWGQRPAGQQVGVGQSGHEWPVGRQIEGHAL